MEKNLGLYIHIPFCVSKCAYCDFLSFPINEKSKQTDTASWHVVAQYVEALLKEIESYQRKEYKSYHVNTIFVGGGTPSILASEEVQRIFRALYKNFTIDKEAEISLEVNPGTVTREKVEAWKAVGINRLSIGLQSTNNEELKVLGRAHTFQQFQETFEMIQRAGFTNVNIDLISGIPGQTLEGFSMTLEEIGKYNPKHISTYSLMIEEGTVFGDLYGDRLIGEVASQKKPLSLPTEEVDWEMYKRTEEVLTSFGYQRYEISNYAKDGLVCKHNTRYWEREEYLGIGLGAASLIGNIRFRNIRDMEMYLERVQRNESVREDEETETLTLKEQMDEFVFLGLRQIKGVSKAKFYQCFGEDMEVMYKVPISKLMKENLLIIEGDNVRLTKRGIDLSNAVFVEFISCRT